MLEYLGSTGFSVVLVRADFSKAVWRVGKVFGRRDWIPLTKQ